jgi:hypothetical protein
MTRDYRATGVLPTKTVARRRDAQLENWQCALTHFAAKLPGVTLYEVGHHGSRNATPKTLWNQFTHTGNSSKPGRLDEDIFEMFSEDEKDCAHTQPAR